MIKARNRRHTFELVAWILFALIFFMNVNSVMGGIGQFTSNAPQATQNVFANIASAGDGMQDVAENGILQSAISAVTGQGVTQTAPAEVTVTAPTETGSGNIGQWIDSVGGWFVGFWSPVDTKKEDIAFVDETGLRVDLADASDDFKQLTRPVVAYVPVRDEDVQQMQEA